MSRMHRERDVDLSPLAGRRVAIVGYGSQGRAHALNLRDSGVSVRAALRDGPSRDRAKADGLEVSRLDEAAEADVVALLIPDPAQPALYERHLRGRMKGRTLLFAHGFNMHFKRIDPPAGSDVVLVAPKGPGPLVRDLFVRGSGVPCLVASAQDASGRALATALAYAHALGGTRAAAIETTFAEETETDLFGEQAVLCGGVPALVRAAFETLTAAGYQPEVAYFECLHELKLIVDLLHEGGLPAMLRAVSDTAKYGGLSRGFALADGPVREGMRRLLAGVRDGSFADDWSRESASGGRRLARLSAEALGHELEDVGARLRGLLR